jgi:hypothetical protein
VLPKLFTNADLQAWRRVFRAAMPTPSTEFNLVYVKAVVSLRVAGRPSGATVRFALADGSLIALAYNPLAARNLAANPLHDGRKRAWLDEGKQIWRPERQRLES